MKTIQSKLFTLSLGFLVPINSLFAQTNSNSCPSAPFRNISEIMGWGLCIIARFLIPLLFSLATLYFMWGVFQFIRNADDAKKRKEGREQMTWGIIALAVMVSVWGLVAILRDTFGVENIIPQIK